MIPNKYRKILLFVAFGRLFITKHAENQPIKAQPEKVPNKS